MRALINEIDTGLRPEALLDRLQGEPGVVLLRRTRVCFAPARYSFVVARPFLAFRSFGSRCELQLPPPRRARRRQFGNPWQVLDELMARYELLDEVDLPFPLGGCFGYRGYELKKFVQHNTFRGAAHH